jgi:hypothetical protein
MTTGTIEYAARVHGYKAGERAEVDTSDQRVKDLLEGGYARLITDEAPAAAPSTPPSGPPAQTTRRVTDSPQA